MKHLSRILSLILALTLLFSMAACGTDMESGPSTEDASIATKATTDRTEPSTEPETGPTVAPTQDTEMEEPTEAPTETTTAPTTAPTVHSHKFSAATCTDPKICATCGQTMGEPAGHIWKAATCLSASTCTTCGKTKGSTTDHDYDDGKCSFCGKKDPNANTDSERLVWIPTKGGKKYHRRSGCSNMKGPIQVTVSEAESQGFTPCKKCY